MFFVDRVQEMSVLQTAYEKPESSLFVLYGRRRVGKTTLLSEFCKEKPSLYYLATEESIQANRNAFRLMAADFLQNDLLKSATDASWEMIFSVLLSAQENKKLVIVLDEFQYLGKADKAFPSVFQKIWDTILKNKNVEVILCGSLVHMMMEQTLSYSSPLYGRRTGQIRLKQIPYAYYDRFFPDLDEQTRILYYAVTGGVPKYIELFHPCADIDTAILQNVMTPQSFLYEEPEFLLRQEVQDVGSYFSIIRAMLWSNGSVDVDDDGKVAIDSEATVNTAQYIQNLFIKDKVTPPTAVNWDDSGNNKAYLSGQCAMIFNVGSLLNTIKTDDPDLYENTGIAVMPSGSAGSMVPGILDGYGIFKNANNKDGAKELVKYPYRHR